MSFAFDALWSSGRVAVEGVRLTEHFAAYCTLSQTVIFLPAGWCLIHLPSGLSAGTWRTIGHAQTVADWLEAEEPDWIGRQDITPEDTGVKLPCDETFRSLREEGGAR